MILPSGMRGRNGFATAGALVAMTLLVAAAAATWRIAFNAKGEAQRSHAVTQADLAARAALRTSAVASRLPVDLTLGGSRLVGTIGVAPGVSSQVHLQRVGREWFVVRAEGRHTRPVARRSLGYAVWALHPTARVADAAAVIMGPGSVAADGGSRIRTDSVNVPPPGWAAMCSPVLSAADSVVPSGNLAASATDTTAPVRLGRLDASWLAANADHRVSGLVTPAPVVGVGGCQAAAASNWGDPAGTGACANHRPLVVSDADLVVRGGVGQGVLVVQGNLSLEGGARFWGVVLVSGSLRLSGGSDVTGLVRVGGGVNLTSSAILGSSCTALLALAHPAFAVSRPIPGGWLDPL